MKITTVMIKELREATGAGPLDCRNALQVHNGNIEKATVYLREKELARAAKKANRETDNGLVIVKSAGDSACAIAVNCETDFVARTENFKTLAHRIVDQVLADANLTDAEKLLAASFIDTPGKTTAEIIQELIGKLGENITVRHVARYASKDASIIIEGYVHAGALEGYYGPMEGRVGVLVELGVSDVAADSNALATLAHDLALHIAAFKPSYLSPDDIPDGVMQEERESLMTPAEKNKPDSIKAKIVEGRLNKFYQKVCLLKQPFVKDDTLNIENLLRQKSKEVNALVNVNRFVRFEVGA